MQGYVKCVPRVVAVDVSGSLGGEISEQAVT